MLTNRPAVYSVQEKKLIIHFGLGYLIDIPSIQPPEMYRLLTDEAFVRGEENEATESLRRCMKAWRESQINRLTPEWDSLISL